MSIDKPGIYKLKLFHQNGFEEVEIEIGDDYDNTRAFLVSKWYVEYFNYKKQDRERTNLPYILTFDRKF